MIDHTKPITGLRLAGPGGAGATFRCGRCTLFKSLHGRRMQRVQGLRQYVCAKCAKTGI